MKPRGNELKEPMRRKTGRMLKAAIITIVLFAAIVAAFIGANAVSSRRQHAKSSCCVSTLQVIWTYAKNYEEKYHDNPFGVATNISQLIEMITAENDLYDVVDKHRSLSCNANYTYLFYPPSKTNRNDYPVLTCPVENAHSALGRNQLFLNGVVETTSPSRP